MEEFLAFAGCSLLLLIPPIAIGWGVLTVRRLRRFEERLQRLEERAAHHAPAPHALGEQPAPRAAPPVPEPSVAESTPAPAPEAAPTGAVSAGPPAVRLPPPAAPEIPPLEPPASRPWWSHLEENLGARLPVWLGAAAVALAVAYLVKLSVEMGLLTPVVRVALGLGLGVGLLIGGELLRRSSAYLAQGLSAAGVAALFVSLFAAVQLYDLIGPLTGFLLLAMVTAGAVVLSLRQGPIVAAIGLMGGFLTPALVGSEDSAPGALFTYLLLLQSGLVAVSRRRGWGGLSFLTLVGGMVWVLVFLSDPFAPGDSAWLGFYLLGSAGVFLASLFLAAGEEEAAPTVTLVIWGALGGGLLLAGLLTAKVSYTPLEWLVTALLSVACLVLGWHEKRYHGLAWFAAGAVAVLLFLWAVDFEAEAWRFYTTLGLFAALFSGGAWLAHRGATRRASWAALAVTVGIVYLLLAYGFGLDADHGDFHWGLLALALAALAVATARPTLAEEERHDQQEGVLAAWVLGAAWLTSLAPPFELEGLRLSMAWSLEIPLLVWLAGRFRIDALAKWAGVLVAVVGLRLLANPMILEEALGETMIWNALLPGYGLPILALTATALLARRQLRDWLALMAGIAALVLVPALVTLEIRHAFHGQLRYGDVTHAENYAYSLAWIALGILFILAGVARRSGLLRWAALAVMVPAVFKVFLWDTAHLEGFWRVLSLFGLGASLFLLAFLYQRFVVRGRPEEST